MFHYEILGDPTTAIDTAKTAFEEAIPKLESLAGEEEYKVTKHTLPALATMLTRCLLLLCHTFSLRMPL